MSTAERIEARKAVDELLRTAQERYSEEPDRVLDWAGEALEESRRIGYRFGEGMSHLRLALFFLKDDRVEAARNLDMAERIFIDTSDKRGRIHVLITRARFLSGNEQAELDRAIRLYHQALDLCSPEEDYHNELAQIYVFLAGSYRMNKKIEQSDRFLELGFPFVGDDYSRAIYYNQFAINAMEKKEYEKALDNYQKAEALFGEMDLLKRKAQTIYNISSLYRDMKDFGESLKHLDKIQIIAEESEDYEWLTMVNVLRAEIFEIQNKKGKAQELYQMCLELFPKMNNMHLKAHVHFLIATFYQQQGEFKKANKELNDYLLIKENIENEVRSTALVKAQEELSTKIKEQEIVILKKKNQIQLMIFGLVFLVTFFLVFMLLRHFFHLWTFWKKQKYIGQYRLLEQVGSGGMGVVFRAQSLKDKRQVVAVKVLKDELMGNEENRCRFRREGEIIDRLDHPNIVKVIERGEDDGRYYLALEYLSGESLEEIIEADDYWSLQRKLQLMRQIASALVAIHDAGIVHRDLKPSNIMVLADKNNNDRAKLLDFGLAHLWYHSKLTQTGVIMGTLCYQAPEQFKELKSGPEVDVYALGLIFFEFLSHTRLKSNISLSDVGKQICNGEFLPQDFKSTIPDCITRIIKNMTHPNPIQRPTSKIIHTLISELIETVK